MADTDSSDHFFSAPEILSPTHRDNLQAPPYADDPILICSLPETPFSSASTSSQSEQTLDPPTCNTPRSLPVRKKTSSVLRRRSKGAKIRSSDSDEDKRGDSSGKERLEDGCVNPSFDRKCGDGSTESMAPSEQKLVDLLDFVKMMCAKKNGRFEDTDILEIAAMKGIYFPPPSWWRPGGYGPEKS